MKTEIVSSLVSHPLRLETWQGSITSEKVFLMRQGHGAPSMKVQCLRTDNCIAWIFRRLFSCFFVDHYFHGHKCTISKRKLLEMGKQIWGSDDFESLFVGEKQQRKVAHVLLNLVLDGTKTIDGRTFTQSILNRTTSPSILDECRLQRVSHEVLQEIFQKVQQDIVDQIERGKRSLDWSSYNTVLKEIAKRRIVDVFFNPAMEGDEIDHLRDEESWSALLEWIDLKEQSEKEL